MVKSVHDTIKLRVVFDTSARTTSGSSLNDIVFTGPELQQNISTLLMSCHLQRYIFTADIYKVYHQINYFLQTTNINIFYAVIVLRASTRIRFVHRHLRSCVLAISSNPGIAPTRHGRRSHLSNRDECVNIPNVCGWYHNRCPIRAFSPNTPQITLSPPGKWWICIEEVGEQLSRSTSNHSRRRVLGDKSIFIYIISINSISRMTHVWRFQAFIGTPSYMRSLTIVTMSI